MLIWLIAFLLLALIICMSGGSALPVTAGAAAMAASYPSSPAYACCALPARFGRGTARTDRAEHEDRHRRVKVRDGPAVGF
jgi:hypothetical protein